MPHWTLEPLTIDITLKSLHNKNFVAATKQLFLEHIYLNYDDFLHIYTDGSKTDYSTSAAFYVHRYEIQQVTRLNKFLSIFTVELYAILKALYWISTKRLVNNLIISDSLSSLQALSTSFYKKKT